MNELIKTGETTLKQKAMQIYNDYFKNANNSSNSYKSSSKYLIEFPPDISEKIEEYYKNGFEMDNLGSIYDGAYAFALEKCKTGIQNIMEGREFNDLEESK